jgi:LPXTG-motif cell wall-anchored protein
VEGWTWGLGSVTEAPPPPNVSFAEVCQGAAVTGAATGTPSVDWLSYAPFAGALLLLGGLALVVRRRRTGGRTL